MLVITCRLVAISLLAAAILKTPVSLMGAEKEKAGAADAAAKADPAAIEKKQTRFPFRGKLAAVDKKEMTISIEGKEKKRIVHITSQTRISKEGKPATLDEAAVGEDVAGLVSRTADGKEEAISLRIGAKPDTAPKKKRTEEK